MIVEERMLTFINSMDSGNPEYLNELEKYDFKMFILFSTISKLRDIDLL